MPVPLVGLISIYACPNNVPLREEVCLIVGRGKMTRTQWCKVLGINRRTLYRWEQEIVNNVLGFRYIFAKRKKYRGYDEYQRFVTLMIANILKTQGDYQLVVDLFNQPVIGSDKKLWSFFGEQQIKEFLCLN